MWVGGASILLACGLFGVSFRVLRFCNDHYRSVSTLLRNFKDAIFARCYVEYIYFNMYLLYTKVTRNKVKLGKHNLCVKIIF